jgi:hypothetical protein
LPRISTYDLSADRCSHVIQGQKHVLAVDETVIVVFYDAFGIFRKDLDWTYPEFVDTKLSSILEG